METTSHLINSIVGAYCSYKIVREWITNYQFYGWQLYLIKVDIVSLIKWAILMSIGNTIIQVLLFDILLKK